MHAKYCFILLMVMKRKELVLLISILWIAIGVASCGLDMPKEVKTSFETMNVKKQDITIPMKFSARLKGQADVTITPQVSGQLMKICVTEGQQITKGQVLL